jgi:hypothetical protein
VRRSNPRFIRFTCAATLSALAAASAPDAALGGQESHSRLSHASQDVRLLVDTLKEHHPKLRFFDVRLRFDSLARVVIRRVDILPRPRAILEIARLLASLEDGHTQIGLWWDDSIAFTRYPLRAFLFDDGVFITRAGSEAQRLLGKRIVRIGDVPIDRVISRLRPFLHGDNEMSRRDILETRLILHQVLEAVGATKGGRATFVVADSTGRLDSLTLSPAKGEPSAPLASALDQATPLPLYLRHRDATYWLTPVTGTRTVYAQINAMQSDSAFSFAQFCDSLFRAMATVGSDRLILDLRLNNGGDNSLDDEFVRRLIRATAIDRPGHFYVITGRKTFSAAVNLTAELERHTSAILVGEPTAAPANHYGETQRFVLPHSGITVLYSTLYWQSGDPRDARVSIEPSLRTPLRFSDYRTNGDPAVEAILARPVPPEQ